MKIKIDIVSDIVCPFCYLGENNLEKAIEQTKGDYDFEINFKPFELGPDIPIQGLDRMQHMVNKFGSEERVKTMDLHMRKNAAAHGLAYNPELTVLAPNTFNAHRLIWLAQQYDNQVAVAKALFIAYFVNGDFVGDVEVLKSIGLKHQIPKERLNTFFESSEGVNEVKDLEDTYHAMGITAVPAFIINNQYSISGAQATETFVDAFKQIASKSSAYKE